MTYQEADAIIRKKYNADDIWDLTYAGENETHFLLYYGKAGYPPCPGMPGLLYEKKTGSIETTPPIPPLENIGKVSRNQFTTLFDIPITKDW